MITACHQKEVASSFGLFGLRFVVSLECLVCQSDQVGLGHDTVGIVINDAFTLRIVTQGRVIDFDLGFHKWPVKKRRTISLNLAGLANPKTKVNKWRAAAWVMPS